MIFLNLTKLSVEYDPDRRYFRVLFDGKRLAATTTSQEAFEIARGIIRLDPSLKDASDEYIEENFNLVDY